MAWFVRAVEGFLPTRSPDPVEHLRTQLFVAFSFLALVNAVMFTALHAIHHQPGGPLTVIGFMAALGLCGLVAPFALRAGKPADVVIPTAMVCIETGIAAVVCFDGGLASGGMFWLAFTPLAAAFVGSTRLGWTIAGMSILLGGAVFTAEAMGHSFPTALTPEHARIHYVVNFLCAAGLTAGLAALYEGPMAKGLRRLSAQLAQAEASSRAKDVLLANLSHEFRTPLTAILSGAEVLAMDATADDRPVLDSVERGARRLLATLDGVIDLSRIQQGTGGLAITPVDIAPVVRGAVSPYVDIAARRGVEVRVEVPPTQAAVDPGAFARLLGELLDNAVRFTEAGAVTIAVEPQVGGVTVVVRDTGVGMDADTLRRATEPFWQASEGHGRTHEGLGVGLALAYRLAEAMGGRLSLHSAPGVGTTARVMLPVPSALAPARARGALGGDGAPAGSRHRTPSDLIA